MSAFLICFPGFKNGHLPDNSLEFMIICMSLIDIFQSLELQKATLNTRPSFRSPACEILWDPTHLSSKIKTPVFFDFSVSHSLYTKAILAPPFRFLACLERQWQHRSPTIFLTPDLLCSQNLILKYKIQKDNISE